MTTAVATRKSAKIVLSYATTARVLARTVAEQLESDGATIVLLNELTAGGTYTDAVRRAMATSSAIVVVLSDVAARRDIPANILFEIGLGIGAGKPIFVVTDDMSHRLPFGAPQLRVLPSNRVDEITRHLAA